jgi:hypothetical protein
VILKTWLHERRPAPPARLAGRIEEVLGTRCEADGAGAFAHCLDAAEGLLNDLVARPSAGRESALDLLTVDALVTYAFEAAAEVPASIESNATAAMIRLAATARQ